jgi:excisionase family DNA binding protein
LQNSWTQWTQRPLRPAFPQLSTNSIEALLDHLADRIAQRVTERLAADAVDAADAAEPWLSAKQAAEHLACPTSRIHDLVAQHKLHPARDGRRLAFKRSDLDNYMESKR